MSIAVERVKEHISTSGLTVKQISDALKIDESTYYRKMANQGKTFSIEQVQTLTGLLNLSKQEAREIFFP